MKKAVVCVVLVSLVGAGIYFFREESHSEVWGEVGTSESAVLSERRMPEEVLPLSRREIIAALPERPPAFGLHGVSKNQKIAMDVYRQLGAMDGEKALDFLMDKYGAGHPGLSYTMGYAFSGWMEKDLEGALAAFKGFLRVSDGFVVTNFKDPYLFTWKGTNFHSGLL